MAKYVVRPELLDALMMAESGGNPNAVSPKGARGAFQIMPKTARDPGFGIMPLRDNSKEEQRRFATDYLGAMLDKFGGDEAMAVAAYNAGPGAVEKHGDIPPFRETQGYVAKIGRLLNPISSAQAEDAPQVTQESPMQYSAQDDFDKVWEQAQQTQPAQAEQADPFDQVWEQAQQKQTKEPDTGYALPNFLSGVGAETLKQAGAVAELLGADTGAKNLYAASEQGKQDAPGMAGAAGQFAGAIAPFMLMPQAGALSPGSATSLGNVLARLGLSPSAASSAAQMAVKAAPAIENLSGQAALSYGLTPGEFEQRGSATASSVAGSLLAPALTKGISKAVTGFTPSKEAQTLLNRDIVPTVGEGIEQGIIGKSIRKAEEAAASIPLLGSAIRHARDRSANEWAKDIMKRAEIPSLGITAGGKTGEEAIDALKKGFNYAYDNQLLGRTIPVNKPLLNQIQQLVINPINGIDLHAQEMIRKNISARLSAIGKNGISSANDFKKATTSLFTEANRYMKSLDPMQQNIGRVYQNAAFKLVEHRNAHLPADVVNKLNQIDKKYGTFITLKDAASSIGAAKNYGEFTGAQLMRSVRANDRSYRKDAFSRGEALLQKDALAAQKVLGDTLPDSGTPARLITGSLLSGLGGFVAPNAIPAYLATTAIGSLGSMRPVQKALLGGYKWQHGLANAIDQYVTPRMAPGAAGLGYYLYDQSR